jgi:colanic acid/amylovoran biosynthesis glycosyltransferase
LGYELQQPDNAAESAAQPLIPVRIVFLPMVTPEKIACLAPEIPALSATFVYKEIAALSKCGFEVTPISVHKPSQVAGEKTLDALKQKTVYLYSRPKWGIIKNHLWFAAGNFATYGKWIGLSVYDALRAGLFKRTGIGILYRFFMAVECATLLRKEACRHIHAHFAHIPTDIAMYAAGLAGISFSFTAHANDLFQRGWLLKEKVARSSFAICISEFNRQYLASCGADPDKLHVIHCGVETDAFECETSTGLGNPPQIGVLCRLVEKKGIDVLIKACKLLVNTGSPVAVTIAGDGPLRKELETLVSELHLSQHIFFIGNLAHEKVTDWLKTLDVFVLPCKKDAHNDQDGIPVVLMEAMAAGVNVVSTRISGIPELIEDGNCGLLAEPGDPESLAKAIRKILEDRSAARQFRENAALKVEKKFNLGINANLLSNLIRKSMR